MSSRNKIYILGAGAIGFPLAVYLTNAGREVVAVRTSKNIEWTGTQVITAQNGSNRVSIPVQTAPLSSLTHLEGMIVITAKSYANQAIAQALKEKVVAGPVVILQNGMGVEQPFLDAKFSPVYRCVLYITSQAKSETEFSIRPIKPCPIGVIHGSESELARCVETLNTDGFPFCTEANIQKEIWKKAIINSVFNSICPLLEIDNGIFHRDPETASLARELVNECLLVTQRLQIDLSEGEIMDQIMQISKGADGQLISTLQDIQAGRPTEIDFLNLAIARVGAAQEPSIDLPKTELLGKMIRLKSVL